MKFTAIVFAGLVALAAAAPSGDLEDRTPSEARGPPPPPKKCKPGTYACATNSKTGEPGWKICNTSGKYVVRPPSEKVQMDDRYTDEEQYGGDCPPDTVCKFFEPSKSPYCVPPDFEFP